MDPLFKSDVRNMKGTSIQPDGISRWYSPCFCLLQSAGSRRSRCSLFYSQPITPSLKAQQHLGAAKPALTGSQLSQSSTASVFDWRSHYIRFIMKACWIFYILIVNFMPWYEEQSSVVLSTVRKWYPLRNGRICSRWLDSRDVYSRAQVFVFSCKVAWTIWATRNQFLSTRTVNFSPLERALFSNGRGIGHSILTAQ